MVFVVLLQCYGLHIGIDALAVLILFGLCDGRYWRVLGSSGGFVLLWVVWVFRGVLCYHGLCFSVSILSAAGLPCSVGVVALCGALSRYALKLL